MAAETVRDARTLVEIAAEKGNVLSVVRSFPLAKKLTEATVDPFAGVTVAMSACLTHLRDRLGGAGGVGGATVVVGTVVVATGFSIWCWTPEPSLGSQSSAADLGCPVAGSSPHDPTMTPTVGARGTAAAPCNSSRRRRIENEPLPCTSSGSSRTIAQVVPVHRSSWLGSRVGQIDRLTSGFPSSLTSTKT